MGDWCRMQTMKFDIVDQYMLWVECINHDMMETDEVVGVAQCSLLPAFKRGQSPCTVTYEEALVLPLYTCQSSACRGIT